MHSKYMYTYKCTCKCTTLCCFKLQIKNKWHAYTCTCSAWLHVEIMVLVRFCCSCRQSITQSSCTTFCKIIQLEYNTKWIIKLLYVYLHRWDWGRAWHCSIPRPSQRTEKLRCHTHTHTYIITYYCLYGLPFIFREDKGSFNTVVDAVKTNYNERFDEICKKWGGGIMGFKTNAARAKIEKLKAKKLAQKM